MRVVDSFGNVYLRSISRPHNYNLNMESQENTIIAGDVNADGEINIADVNLIVDIILSGTLHGCPQILADCNADDEISIADVNSVIDLIIKQ